MSKDTFTLTIELGNAAMQTPDDVAASLHTVASYLRDSDEWDLGLDAGNVRDVNGNTVGSWITRLPAMTLSKEVYVIASSTYPDIDPWVFADEDDARAFSAARFDGWESVIRLTIIDRDLAARMIAEEIHETKTRIAAIDELPMRFDEDHAEDGSDCPRCDGWIPAYRQSCPDCDYPTED